MDNIGLFAVWLMLGAWFVFAIIVLIKIELAERKMKNKRKKDNKKGESK